MHFNYTLKLALNCPSRVLFLEFVGIRWKDLVLLFMLCRCNWIVIILHHICELDLCMLVSYLADAWVATCLINCTEHKLANILLIVGNAASAVCLFLLSNQHWQGNYIDNCCPWSRNHHNYHGVEASVS